MTEERLTEYDDYVENCHRDDCVAYCYVEWLDKVYDGPDVYMGDFPYADNN